MKPISRSSSLDRELTCYGSATLVPLVAERDGDEGFEGTYIHWAIAARLIREFGATPPEGGLPPPDVPKGYKLPAFSLWIVDWAIRHVREVIPADWSLMVEVEMEHEFDRWINRGHADLIAISPDGTQSKGMDYKTGRDPVDPADNNWQVASYIALQACEWPTLTSASFDIVQPRVCEEDDFQRVSTVNVTDLPALVASLDSAKCAALDNAMELNSGRKQCRWCSVGIQCPALQAENSLMKVTLTPESLARIKREPDDAQLGDWVIVARTLDRPTKDATELLHERLDKNPSLVAGCGTTITRKIQRGSYTWPDPLAAFQAVKELLPEDASLARVMEPSVTRIKDEIASVMNVPKTGKADVTAESVFDARIRPLVVQGERKLLQFS